MDSGLTVTELLIKTHPAAESVKALSGLKREKRLTTEIEDILDSDENPIDMTFGHTKHKDGNNTMGLAVVTNKRFIYNGYLFLKTFMEEIPLDRIESIQPGRGKGGRQEGLKILSTDSTFYLYSRLDDSRFIGNVRIAIENCQNNNQDSGKIPQMQPKKISGAWKKNNSPKKLVTEADYREQQKLKSLEEKQEHRLQQKEEDPKPTGEKKFCSQCGEKLTIGAKFCSECGAAV